MALVFLLFPADANCCSSAECGHGLSRLASGKILTFLILLLPITAAAMFSPDGFGKNAVLNRGIITDASALRPPRRKRSRHRARSAAADERARRPRRLGTTAARTAADAASTPATAPADYLQRTPDGRIVAEVLDLLYAAQDNALRKDFENKPVELIGQLMPDATNNASGKRFKAVRMFMTCCAADARPVATLVESETQAGPAGDDVDQGHRHRDFPDRKWAPHRGAQGGRKSRNASRPRSRCCIEARIGVERPRSVDACVRGVLAHYPAPMLPEIEKLLVLQDRDRKIRTLKQELKMAPLERKELEEKLAAALKQLEAVKLKAKEIEVERKKLEIEAQAKRDQIAKFQTQKFQTRKNEEFQALNNEITRYEGEIRGDRRSRTRTDGKRRKGEGDHRRRPTRKRRPIEGAGRAATRRYRREDRGARRAAQGARSRTRAASPPASTKICSTLSTASSPTKTEAVVALEHDVCMGCHMKVTTQTVVR